MSDPFNNSVTYNDKWQTPENLNYLKMIEKKYFDKSLCSPDCPTSWAKEVLEMLDTIENELGFRYNEHTMRGYHVQGNMKDWFLVDPWSAFFSSVRRNIFGSPYTYQRRKGCQPEGKRFMTVGERLSNVWESTTHPIKYGFRALRIKWINPHLNRIQKRRVELSQIKEKYGTLRLYFSAPDAYEEFIERELRKCEIKLAMKGAYYPVEDFWDAACSYNIENNYEPDSVTVTTEVEPDGTRTVNLSKTTYRKAMKELGLNLDDIKQKAEAKKNGKEVL